MALDDKIEHRWMKNDKDGSWRVYCEVEHDSFSPRCEAFDDNGRCPLCGSNAKKELADRKLKREIEQGKQKTITNFNGHATLDNWGDKE